MAQSGHTELHRTCPLLGVKRTCRFALHMSAFDPKRTWGLTRSMQLSRSSVKSILMLSWWECMGFLISRANDVSIYSHGEYRHCDPDCPASDAGRGEDMGGADRGKGPEAAARARKPYAAPLFRWASALALIGMAAAMITRRRAAWPVRRVSMRSRTTRQSPAYAPCDSFAVVSVLPPD